eukprot:NODE_17782_length_926_cov_3.884856.p1 GENE.NODE_17782_length_926_cov_3.884856~~NODE_17782_length_926_cov_3.884856.p1  ORF type:complete len:181 (-),score=36.98 NODE_17782_length_926_cov_3.884856:220-762(-)
MSAFLDGARQYRAALATFGTAVSLVLADFDKNYSRVEEFFNRDPIAHVTARLFLDAQQHSRDNCAVNCQWLFLGMHFFTTWLKLMFEGDANCVSNAYAQTLQPYHKTLTSWVLRSALMATPGRAAICKLQFLCPAAAHDERQLAEAISRDIPRAMALMWPVLGIMMSLQQDLGLWKKDKV